MIFSVKRFTDDDFQKESTVERIYMSIVQPIDFQLTRQEQVYSELLTKVYPIIVSRTENEAILMIENLERGKWRSQVEKIYKDAKRLYDPMSAANAMIANIARQRRIAIAEKLEAIAVDSDDNRIVVAALSAADRVWSSFDEKPSKSKSKKDKFPIQNTLALPPMTMPELPMHECYEAERKTEIMADRDAKN